MNIKLLFFTSTILSTLALNGQTFDTKTLSVNNHKIGLQSNGDFHRSSDLTQSISEFPNSSGTNCIYAQSLWLGGINQNSELKLGANVYRQSGLDFYPGPIATTYSTAYDNMYDNVWHLTKDEVETHMANYNTAGYIVPNAIALWPGNGNTANGEAQNLAPYADLNNNNFYEPELGEHPLIRGDEALYVIYNDNRAPHTESGGGIIGAEVHLMLYAYENTGEDHIDNVIYSHYEIYNRSPDNNFDNFYISSWLDFEIGNGSDDFVGTQTQQNMIYGYNGSSSDLDYGTNPPAYGFILLNENLTHSMLYNNDNNPVAGNPTIPADYYNYMISNWKNGTHLMNLVDSAEIDYIYPGDSDTTNYANWSEITDGNAPSDRRMLGSTHFQNFGPGNKICLDYAAIFARDMSLNNVEQVDHLSSIATSVQNFYYNQYDDCEDISDLALIEININAINSIKITNENQNYTIQLDQALTMDLNINVVDILGRSISNSILKQGDKELTIQISPSNKGIYFVNCKNTEINESVKLLID